MTYICTWIRLWQNYGYGPVVSLFVRQTLRPDYRASPVDIVIMPLHLKQQSIFNGGLVLENISEDTYGIWGVFNTLNFHIRIVWKLKTDQNLGWLYVFEAFWSCVFDFCELLTSGADSNWGASNIWGFLSFVVLVKWGFLARGDPWLQNTSQRLKILGWWGTFSLRISCYLGASGVWH